MPPLRFLLAVLAGLLLARPTLRQREREAADVGQTIARYMVERDRETAAREAEALKVARSTRKWAVLACCVSAAGALLAIFT